ncbi:polyprenyl synthetase family protein [Nocardia brasiliensis]|uniref:polyprenyl synthetase family protein n=1 Tax=Nocardia brasiliensis TaxID=37326 RepID=UPI002454A3D4|nr:polyprenyl synthetase family protein [Nocardia brasiliensis]
MSTVYFDPVGPSRTAAGWDRGRDFARWQQELRDRVLGELEDFLRQARIEELAITGVDEVLRQYVLGGKCLRSTFMYLGWLCGEEPDPAAVRAAASLELLHAFALLQDDVMDEGMLRRGEAAAHLRLAERHHTNGRSGSAARFGASAATLLGDMCLVWAEQMLRDSGIAPDALARLWSLYDRMRIELAVGQFADLSNDSREMPTLDAVLAIARAKSGNYTVRRPLELGAALADCPAATRTVLGRYGTLIGEAFQLRDDLLGVFGSAAVTGKPEDSDLGQHKATSVVVTAFEVADSATRIELAELTGQPVLDTAAIARCRELIASSGAPEYIESMIADRVTDATAMLGAAALASDRRAALEHMALLCTARQL